MQDLMNNPVPFGMEPMGIGELTNNIKMLLEGRFANVWVAGEISNLSRPQSGHIYLTLKDSSAQLKSVIYRGVALRTRFDSATAWTYSRAVESRSTLLKVSINSPLKNATPRASACRTSLATVEGKVAGEGLFRSESKKTTSRPTAMDRSGHESDRRSSARYARTVGPALAVCRSMGLSGSRSGRKCCCRNRHGDSRIEPNALPESCDPRCHDRRRGGGSLEDLWAFNEEIVADAIFASALPVMGGGS